MPREGEKEGGEIERGQREERKRDGDGKIAMGQSEGGGGARSIVTSILPFFQYIPMHSGKAVVPCGLEHNAVDISS